MKNISERTDLLYGSVVIPEYYIPIPIKTDDDIKFEKRARRKESIIASLLYLGQLCGRTLFGYSVLKLLFVCSK